MYVIYVGHSKDHQIYKTFKKSSLNYNNNIIYEPQSHDIDDIRNIISESQFVILDITKPTINNGIVIGVALEKNVKVILIDNKETDDKLTGKYEIINYTEDNYTEICSKIEKLLLE